MTDEVGDDRGEERGQDEQDDEGGRDESHPVVPQPFPGQRPLTAALDGVLLGLVSRGLLPFAVVFRRRGLAVSLGLIGLVLIGLALKIRESSREE